MINGKSLSLCMVVFNSSDRVEELKESLKDIVDEVVIIDQGSTQIHADKLKSLASIYCRTTNKGNADYDRSYCYALANSEYILAMDADETITKENIEALKGITTQYSPDVIWIMFNNSAFYQGTTTKVEKDLKKFLGEDPHPRFWKRKIVVNGQDAPMINWPTEAHVFPKINSDRQIFSKLHIEHNRNLTDIINTHIHRGKNISPNAQQVEKNFIRTILGEFGDEVKTELEKEIPELSTYLRN